AHAAYRGHLGLLVGPASWGGTRGPRRATDSGSHGAGIGGADYRGSPLRQRVEDFAPRGLPRDAGNPARRQTRDRAASEGTPSGGGRWYRNTPWIAGGGRLRAVP